jgi:hypothetical protein
VRRLRQAARRRTLIAAVVAAPWVAWALLRGLALDRWPPLVMLVSFTPVRRRDGDRARRRRRRAAALRRRGGGGRRAVLLVAWSRRGRSAGRRTSRPGRPTLTVVSSNLYVGEADLAAWSRWPGASAPTWSACRRRRPRRCARWPRRA